jgi:hypothetical protein
MVVPVLMTSCQVSENPKNGPLTSHPAMMTHARTNAAVLPAQWATAVENCSAA